MSTGANAITFQSVMDDAKELGEAAGRGDNVQSQFALKLIEAGYHGALDITKDKHGKGMDDARVVSEAYVKARASQTIFNAKAGNQQKLMSCARKLIEFGGVTKFGKDEPLQITNTTMSLWSKERAKPESRGKLDDAFNTIMKLAREQLGRDQLLDDTELLQLCYKTKHGLRSAEKIIYAIRKEAQALYQGKASQGTVKDASAEVKEIIKNCDTLLERYAAKKPQKTTKKAA